VPSCTLVQLLRIRASRACLTRSDPPVRECRALCPFLEKWSALARAAGTASGARDRSVTRVARGAARVALDRAGRLDRYGRENLVADLDEALARAQTFLSGSHKNV